MFRKNALTGVIIFAAFLLAGVLLIDRLYGLNAIIWVSWKEMGLITALSMLVVSARTLAIAVLLPTCRQHCIPAVFLALQVSTVAAMIVPKINGPTFMAILKSKMRVPLLESAFAVGFTNIAALLILSGLAFYSIASTVSVFSVFSLFVLGIAASAVSLSIMLLMFPEQRQRVWVTMKNIPGVKGLELVGFEGRTIKKIPSSVVAIVVWQSLLLVSVHVCFALLGHSLSVSELFAVFCASGVAQLAAITPGSLGVREAAVVIAASASGIPDDIAISAALIERCGLILSQLISMPAAIFFFRSRSSEA